MARYDIYANPDPEERKKVPYFIDVQNDFLGPLETRVVVPLRFSASFPPRTRNLNPELVVEGRKVVLDAAAIGAVPMAELRRPVANMNSARLEIQDALDTLLGAY
ncbi:CcdB family protein [Ramlibacter sp.]|uniref:CcdB family protein n=1 Tax=Ramlibacter sp. TaxID=1917967 RepID=UPI003D11D333